MPGFFTPQGMGQQTPAVQALFGPRSTTKRRSRRKTSVRSLAGGSRPRKKAAAAGGRKRLVKGSPAAKAWGAKMRRLRKRK